MKIVIQGRGFRVTEGLAEIIRLEVSRQSEHLLARRRERPGTGMRRQSFARDDHPYAERSREERSTTRSRAPRSTTRPESPCES